MIPRRKAGTMGQIGWLVIYCAAILMVSLAGGYLPFRGRITHDRLQIYLSAAAGVMLGAAFFHLMPDAIKLCGSEAAFGWWISLGAVGTFSIERFIAPHTHEVNGHHHHHHEHDVKGMEPGHGEHHDDRKSAAPSMAGWMAILGLTIHTFMNGVAMAGSVQADVGTKMGFWGGAVPPGFMLFLAIVLHKPADALAISMVLTRKNASRFKVVLVQLGFGLMVPVGVIGFVLTRGALQESLRNQLTGAALAFSSGTFLFIALSDLLPELQFHRHDRVPLFLSLLAGIALMGGISYLEDQDEPGDKPEEKPAAHGRAIPAGEGSGAAETRHP